MLSESHFSRHRLHINTILVSCFFLTIFYHVICLVCSVRLDCCSFCKLSSTYPLRIVLGGLGVIGGVSSTVDPTSQTASKGQDAFEAIMTVQQINDSGTGNQNSEEERYTNRSAASYSTAICFKPCSERRKFWNLPANFDSCGLCSFNPPREVMFIALPGLEFCTFL